MKTIELRATEFALDAHDFDCGDCNTCSKCKDYRKYVDIATEQREIDIEKASKWFKRNAEEYFEISIKYGDTSIELSRKFFDDFRKAMED